MEYSYQKDAVFVEKINENCAIGVSADDRIPGKLATAGKADARISAMRSLICGEGSDGSDSSVCDIAVSAVPPDSTIRRDSTGSTSLRGNGDAPNAPAERSATRREP